MLRLREWFRPPLHLLALFVTVIVVPAAALAWLAARTLEQDRALAGQRLQDRLDAAADSLVSDLQHRLDGLSRDLPALAVRPPADLPPDSVILTMTAEDLTGAPSGRLLFVPSVPAGPRPASPALDAAEAFEFRAGDLDRAARAFRDAAKSRDSAERAAALIGLARCLRKRGMAREALRVYDQLAALGALRIEGVPAELVARHAQGVMLSELRSPDLPRHARALFDDLQRPRWTLDRSAYELYSSETRAWLPPGTSGPDADLVRLSLSEAALDLARLRGQETAKADHGRRSLWVRGRPLLLVWNDTPGRTRALVAGPAWLQRWEAARSSQRIVVVLTDGDAHAVLGDPGRLTRPQAMRSAADTGLPWTLRVASEDPAADLAASAGQRRVILGGLGLVGLLVLLGGYLVTRAVSRELAVARLQTDFVATVSHEFRSPLTSMKHLLEMLEQNAVPSEDRRRRYYEVLSRETERLHRLVEDLLNFQRMEAGRAEYVLEPLDAAALVKAAAEDFAGHLEAADRLTVEVAAPDAVVHADREALSRAIWNLLDNAAKYSPDGQAITLRLDAAGGAVRIAVRDRGPGIPTMEQAQVFGRFYRAPSAIKAGVRGTGIGLASVQHIVRAHGGEVELESSPGHGSTFTIVLPAVTRSEEQGAG
jgi:signal transduction histidine kinase